MSNNNFLFTTLLTNHVSRNLFVIYLCTFYQQSQLFNFCNHVPTQLRNQFHFFLQLFVNKQPIQLIFQQSACQPNHYISTQQFYFLVFYRSSLIFFWSDLPFLCQVFRGSHVEDRLTLIPDCSITCELYVMRNSMYT